MFRKPTTRVNVTIHNDTKRAIDRMVSEQNISVSAATNILISHGMKVEAAVSAGAEVIIREPNGNEWALASPNPRNLLNSWTDGEWK